MRKDSKHIILLLSASLLCACGGNQPQEASSIASSASSSDAASSEVSSSEISSETPTSEVISYSRANPRVIDEVTENSPTVELVAPFSILDEAGEPAVINYNENGAAASGIPNVYDNMFEAIRVAGTNSTSQKICQVQDANFTQIFKRGKKSSVYVFDGHDYVGNCTETKSKKYINGHPQSYAINGQATDYYYLGRDDMSENLSVTERTLETNAGAYNYMFSKGGDGSVNGFSYATCDVHLSETIYRPTQDGHGWNAYIFVNLARGLNADLGLIGIFNKGLKRCEWKMVRNCSSTYHSTGTSGVERDARFYVYQDKMVTYSTIFNEETQECSGFDDLHFEAFAMDNGWTLNITNLRTKMVQSFTDTHSSDDNTGKAYGRALIAASYCPVTGNVWNWDCGAKLTNVVFDNIELTRTLDDVSKANDIEAYRDTSLERVPLYPDEDAYKEGYSQGAFCSSHLFGSHEEDGSYASGIAFEKGQKYISYSVDYNSGIE